MKTLAANFSTQLKLSSSQEVRYIIKMERSLIASPYTVSYFYLSSNAKFGTNDLGITDTSVFPVAPIILNAPSITEKMNLKKNTSSVGGFSLVLDNSFKFANLANSNALEVFSDQLNKYNIYNRSIEIKLWISGLSDIDDCLTIYKGITKDLKIDNNLINISVENSTFTVQKELPTKIINSTDYPQAETLGKPFGLVYGEHSYNYCNGTRALAVGTLENNLVKGKYLGLDSSNNHRYALAEHECKALNAIWGYDSSLEKFVKPTTFSTETNDDTDGAVVTTGNNPSYIDYHLGDGTVAVSNSGANTTDFANSARASDREFDTASVGSIDTNSGNGAWIKIAVDFPAWRNQNIDDADISHVYGYVYGKKAATNLGGDDYSDWFKIEMSYDDSTWDDVTNWFGDSDTTAHTLLQSSQGDTKTEIADTFYLKITKIQAGLTVTSTITIYEMAKAIYYTSDFLEISGDVNGKMANAALAAEFTALSADDLIENPIHIQADILTNELTTGASLAATFEANDGDLSSWKMAPTIDKAINSKDLLDKIGSQSRSIVYWDSDNVPSSDLVEVVGVGYVTDYEVQTNDIKEIPKLYKSPLKDIINDLELNYQKSGNAGTLQSSVSRADDTADTGSQATYNAVLEEVKNADFIADLTTAASLADHFCKDAGGAFWSDTHNIIEFDTVDLRGVNFWDGATFQPTICLEMGDIIELSTDFDSIEKCFGVSWSGLQFKIIEITRKAGNSHIKAFSV